MEVDVLRFHPEMAVGARAEHLLEPLGVDDQGGPVAGAAGDDQDGDVWITKIRSIAQGVSPPRVATDERFKHRRSVSATLSA